MALYINLRYDDACFDPKGNQFERKLMELMIKYNIKVTFGIVPHCANTRNKKGTIESELFERCKERGLIEVALHGWKHKRNIIDKLLRVRGEFGGKPLVCQEKIINKGIKILQRLNLGEIDTFIPPYNVYDHNTVTALKKNGIKIISAGISESFPTNDIEGILYMPFTAGIQDWEYLAEEALDKDILAVCLFHWYNYPIEKVEKLFEYINRTEAQMVFLKEAAMIKENSVLSGKYYVLKK